MAASQPNSSNAESTTARIRLRELFKVGPVRRLPAGENGIRQVYYQDMAAWFETSARPSRHRIVAMATPWVAAHYTLQREPSTPDCTMLVERLHRIFAA